MLQPLFNDPITRARLCLSVNPTRINSEEFDDDDLIEIVRNQAAPDLQTDMEVSSNTPTRVCI